MSNEVKVKKAREYIEGQIDAVYPKTTSIHNKLVMDAMAYSFKNGGKRLRALLIYATYELGEKKHNDIQPFLAALEMIHTYSLIHDDLPSMDNDDLRRGKPTCHIQYDEATAILAGDALLNMAYELMADACVRNEDIAYRKAMKTLAHGAGIFGMVGGQAADLLYENDENVAKEALAYIHHNKTGQLLAAAMKIGAILSGYEDQEVEVFGNIGFTLGLAFQIQDDILDIESTEEKLGKPIGSDAINHKTTYVSLYGIKKAKVKVDELFDEIYKDIEKYRRSSKVEGMTKITLDEVITYIHHRNY